MRKVNFDSLTDVVSGRWKSAKKQATKQQNHREGKGKARQRPKHDR